MNLITPKGKILRKVIINQDTGCWEWRGYIDDNGYPIGSVDSKKGYAHRLSYEIFVGPVTDGNEIDHKCNNSKCVNPEHLESVTKQENLSRVERNPQYRCVRGHQITPKVQCLECKKVTRNPDEERYIVHIRDIFDRLNALSRASEDCRLWQGKLNSKGYGSTRYEGKTQQVHRVAYKVYIGQIPDGFVINHICKNRSCIEPKHLEAVSQSENIRYSSGNIDMCRAGIHKWTGGRRCIECQKAYSKQYNQKNKSVRVSCIKCHKNLSLDWFRKHEGRCNNA